MPARRDLRSAPTALQADRYRSENSAALAMSTSRAGFRRRARPTEPGISMARRVPGSVSKPAVISSTQPGQSPGSKGVGDTTGLEDQVPGPARITIVTDGRSSHPPGRRWPRPCVGERAAGRPACRSRRGTRLQRSAHGCRCAEKLENRAGASEGDDLTSPGQRYAKAETRSPLRWAASNKSQLGQPAPPSRAPSRPDDSPVRRTLLVLVRHG